MNRFIDLFDRREEKYTVVNSCLFYNYGGIIMPFTPANEDVKITEQQASYILNQLNGKLIRWTEGDFINEESPDWYALICKKFTNIDLVKSKLRNELKKGLSNCRVERIDAHFLSMNGYDVYLKALERYKTYKLNPAEEKTYKKHIISGNNFDDILQYWGIFFNHQLIGYSSNYIFDTTEALYSSIKIDPSFFCYFPSHALIYTMNKNYLEENNFEYVNDGYRSLLHGTNIQNFLIKNFSFFKAGIALKVYYKPFYRRLVKTLYPIRNIVRTFEPRVAALLELEKIRRRYV